MDSIVASFGLEQGLLRVFVFGLVHVGILIIGYYSGWSINRLLKRTSNGHIAGIEVDVIVQNISAENNTDFTFTVDKNDAKKAEDILQKTSQTLGGGSIEVDDDIAKISIVGRGMRAHAGVASKMFQALAKHEINISMITTSEIKISVVIKKEEMENAVQALHDAFDLDKELDT